MLKYYGSEVFLNYRGDSSSGSAAVGERLLSTLLTEMDGLEEAKVSLFIKGKHFILPHFCPLLSTIHSFIKTLVVKV